MTKRKQIQRYKQRRSPAQPPFLPTPKIATTPTVGTDGRIPKAAQPRPTEPIFLHIWVLTRQRWFDSQEELQEFLALYMSAGKKPHFPEPTQPWHQAQDLAYKGWEQESAQQRHQIALQALEISPDAVDGYLLLAHDAASWQEAARLCTQAVTAAERLLGPDPFHTYADGKFWEEVITRPYMRARLALGYALWRQGERAEAQAHFKELLRLNPTDNQGVRYLLVAVLLEQERDSEAQRLMQQYAKDIFCYWAYNRVLWHFRRRGDHPAAHRQLDRAQFLNPHVPALLLGRQPVHSWEIFIVEPGKQSEALDYVLLYRDAWAMTPGALEWLDRSVLRSS